MNDLVNKLLFSVVIVDFLTHLDWIFSVGSWHLNSYLLNWVGNLGWLELTNEVFREGLVVLVVSALVVDDHFVEVGVSLEPMILELSLELAIGESTICVLPDDSFHQFELLPGCLLLRSSAVSSSREPD